VQHRNTCAQQQQVPLRLAEALRCRTEATHAHRDAVVAMPRKAASALSMRAHYAQHHASKSLEMPSRCLTCADVRHRHDRGVKHGSVRHQESSPMASEGIRCWRLTSRPQQRNQAHSVQPLGQLGQLPETITAHWQSRSLRQGLSSVCTAQRAACMMHKRNSKVDDRND
jgi:hypothetical protein